MAITITVGSKVHLDGQSVEKTVSVTFPESTDIGNDLDVGLTVAGWHLLNDAENKSDSKTEDISRRQLEIQSQLIKQVKTSNDSGLN